jgi:hypothetical protein
MHSVCAMGWGVGGRGGCSRHRRHRHSLSRSPIERESGSKRARYYYDRDLDRDRDRDRELDERGRLEPVVAPTFISHSASLAATAAAGLVSFSSDAVATDVGVSVTRGVDDSYSSHHSHHRRHRNSRGHVSEHQSHRSHRDSRSHKQYVVEDGVAFRGVGGGGAVWSDHGLGPTLFPSSSASTCNNNDGPAKDATRVATLTAATAPSVTIPDVAGNSLTKL